MPFQDDPAVIRWRLHLVSPVVKVYQTLTTDSGRASFWAESALERDGHIHFAFPNGFTWVGKILAVVPNQQFTIEYIGGSEASFTLRSDGHGGTDLMLTDSGVGASDRSEVIAGWVSVLLALKAAVDFGVDLRAHDAGRHWDTGYAEN